MADVVTGDAVCAAILATTVDLVNVAPFISATLEQTSYNESTNVVSETLPETAVLAVGGLEEWAVMRAHQPGGALQQISKEPLHHSSERLELWAVWEQIWASSDRLQMRLLDAGTSLGCWRLHPLRFLCFHFRADREEKVGRGPPRRTRVPPLRNQGLAFSAAVPRGNTSLHMQMRAAWRRSHRALSSSKGRLWRASGYL